MSDGLKLQGEVSLSTGNAEDGLDRIGNKAGQMAVNMSEAGAKAGKAVEKIGEIANASGEKFTRAESSIVASIKRVATEAAKAKDVTEKLGNIEFNIAAKGLDPAKFRPMIAVVNELATAQQRLGASKQVSDGFSNVAVSAGQMKAALRGVPAQFTDIAVSLQSGQKPLTVLLQQGGQLKDMFGGIGPAARALGGYVAELITPLNAAAVASTALAVAWYQGSKESARYREALILNGNVAGVTAARLNEMADAISKSTASTKGDAAEALTQLATSGIIAAESFEKVTSAALEMNRSAGKSISETVKEFEELGKSPVEASAKLNEKYHYLTIATFEQIKALDAQGKSMDAARVAIEAYASAVEDRSTKLANNLGYLETSWKGIRDTAKEAWDAMLDIGRDQDPIEAAQKRVDAIRAKLTDAKKNASYDPYGAQAELLNLQRELKASEQLLINEKARAKIVEDVTLAKGKSQREEDEGIKKALNDKSWKSSSEASAYDKLNKSIHERLTLAEAEFNADKDLAEWEKARIKSLFEIDAAGKKLTANEREQLKLAVERTAALRESEANRDAFLKAQKAIADAREKSINGITEEAAKLEQENAALGLNKSAIEDLTISRLEDQLAQKNADGASQETIDALEREISARKRLRAAIAGREVLDANKRATEQMAKDWEKFSDEINRSLTDALMRGFESGKDFGQNFVDSLRTTLKTAVLKVAVQAVVSPITGAVGQAFGLTGSGSSGGAPGLFNLASTGSNLYGLANGSGGGLISGLYGMAATSSFGQTLGLSSAASFVGPSASLASGATAGAAAGEIGLTSLGSSIGAALPWIGGALAIGSALGLFGGGGEDPHNNADSTGLAFKLTKSGVSGTGTGAGITDEVPAYLPYSWVAGQTRGRGRWNDGTALTSAQITQIAQASAAVFASGESIAKTLGLSPSLLNSTTVASTGFKSVEDALSQLGDAIAVSLIPNIKEFQASGETLGTTLARLSSEFVLTEQMAAIMGKSGAAAFGASGLGGRDNLIQLLGGAGTATSAFDAFWQNFYTQGERADYTKSQISSTLKALGLDVIPATRDEFRKLVEAQDLATESGRKMYATLLAVSGSFAGVTDAAAMGGAYGTRDLKTSSFASRTDYLRAQRATGRAEAVIVSDPKVMNELAQLRAQFRNLEASQVSMARFALKSAQVLEKWEGIGMPVERAAL